MGNPVLKNPRRWKNRQIAALAAHLSLQISVLIPSTRVFRTELHDLVRKHGSCALEYACEFRLGKISTILTFRWFKIATHERAIAFSISRMN